MVDGVAMILFFGTMGIKERSQRVYHDPYYSLDMLKSHSDRFVMNGEQWPHRRHC